MALSLIVKPFGEATILEVGGEVDVATAPQLRSRTIELITGGCRRLIVDLTPVGFVDSSGLGVLVGARRRLGELGGELGLVAPVGPVRDVFSATGLDGLFAIAGSPDAFDRRRIDDVC